MSDAAVCGTEGRGLRGLRPSPRRRPAPPVRRIASLALVAWLVAAPAGAQRTVAAAEEASRLPESVLAVWRDGAWHQWWRAGSAPSDWPRADARMAGAVHWHATAPGVELAELRLAGSGEAFRTRVVLVRIDPARVRFRLEERSAARTARGAWTIDSAPPSAIVALDAGQFVGGSPWGWVVSSGVERYSPGYGPLSMVFVVDRGGVARLLAPDSLTPAVRASAAVAFQSYPALLAGEGEVPMALRTPNAGVDVGHRDARLALGTTRDGRLVVALTRFDALGGALASVPFGLTTPEMAALMGALGCSRAVALDGGISAQLLVREAAGGTTHEWHGVRAVPLGLIVERR